MPAVQETAYRRLKSTVSERELREVYTPSREEQALAERSTSGPVALVAFLCLLKTFQPLGYPVPLTAIPRHIVDYLAQHVGQPVTTSDLVTYDASGTRRRHLKVIRDHLGIQPFSRVAQQAMEDAMEAAVLTKDDLVDLINIAIEELVRQRFELPAFSAFERTAAQVRRRSNRRCYLQTLAALSSDEQQRLDALFVVVPATPPTAPSPPTNPSNLASAQSRPSPWTPWNRLKEEPGKATLTHLKELLEHLDWLNGWQMSTITDTAGPALVGIPAVKVKRFATEAATLDAARMQHMQPRKRYTLALSLLVTRKAQALDDLAEMAIKRLLKLHQQGKEGFEAYRSEHQGRVDELIAVLREVTQAYRGEGVLEERLEAIEAAFAGKSAAVLEDCDKHVAFVTNTYYPFLSQFYSSHRALLFKFLRAVTLRSAHQDTALETTISFLVANEHRSGDWLNIGQVERLPFHGYRPRPSSLATPPLAPHLAPLVDLGWMSDVWWRIVSGQRKRTPLPRRVKRQYFEIAVFTQILWDLKIGDLYIEGSDLYANTWAQGISWEEYAERVDAYGEMLDFPVDGPGFVAHLRDWLENTAREVDTAFPESQVTIENGEPIIHKPAKKAAPRDLMYLEAQLAERLEPVNLLDILADVQFWLHWCEFFGPISGFESKLEDAIERYLMTVFAYGTQLGPTQTARSLPDIDRRQLAWIHQHHISEESLDKANTRVINAYARFDLPKRWGSGKRASADGTKWEIHVQNLLAEYHIRYGGYGGIGYYHISDTYIALFSHFIPCGVWEAVYILDGLLKNASEIQPDEVSGDTQAQNTVVFGLAHLLGIRLMPRIRNLKELTFYRPDPQSTYTHIDALFTDTIDWDLIQTHVPDLLRIVLSIKEGSMTASTILRKLSTYSHKNKLYQAFRELGRVVRTVFLLQYLADPELRATIQAATNKSEAFNHFVQWLAFGNGGVIPTNNRAEQRKYLKYNQLLANCVIFATTVAISRALVDLTTEGYAVTGEAIAALSPYVTAHIIRFGRYGLDRSRQPPPLDFGEIDVPSIARTVLQARLLSALPVEKMRS